MKAKRRRKPAIQTSASWNEAFDEIFEHVPADWARPKSVRIWRTRSGYTFSASFHSPKGYRTRCTVRSDASFHDAELQVAP